MRLFAEARAPSVVFVGALSFGSTGCEENCYTSRRRDRREGNVRVYCPGGWLSHAPYHPEREDCRKRGELCVGPFRDNDWVGCMKPIGACEPERFVSRCQPYSSTSATGRMTTCVDGEELASGDSCDALQPKGGK